MRKTDESAVVLHARTVCGTGGGPDKTILNSPRFLRSAGYRLLCAFMHPPGDSGFEVLRQRASRWNADIRSVPDHGPWDFGVLARFLSLCRTERVTIWHGHDYKSNVLGLMLRPFWPMHLVTTVHGWVVETRRTPLYYALDRLALRYYDRVICVSDDLYRECVAGHVPAARCDLVENAIDTDEYARTMPVADAKRKLGFSPSRPIIGSVGRLSPEKGFDLLVRSADALYKSGVDFDVVIVGEGPEQSNLQALIEQLGRHDRIRLLGHRTDMADVYQAMDLFVLNSLREGLPNALLEAMAMTVPVVATPVGGVARLVSDWENGLLVTPGQSDELARGLTRLLGDSDLRARLARAGRDTVETSFSFRHRMSKIRAVYDALPTRLRGVPRRNTRCSSGPQAAAMEYGRSGRVGENRCSA